MSLVVHMMCYQYDNRQEILDALDGIVEVRNWRAAAGGIFIVTDSVVSSHQLAKAVEAALPKLNRFVVAKIDGLASQGRADSETWDFVNEPAAIK